MAEKEYIEREKALEECDWYANEFCECEYAIMPLKGALEILPAADVRPVEWIPVTERLPEKREWVLVRSKLVKMKTDFISNDGTWYTTPGVTHWMPLPEPPKEE